MNINNKTHPHNAVFCEMLQSVIDGTPKTVQYRRYHAGEWHDVSKETNGITQASWDYYRFYRIKPPEPVIVTRTVTYPAPMIEAPAIGTGYFACLIDGATSFTWNSDDVNENWLAAGICHSTCEAAQKQWQAFYGVQK